MRFNQFNPFDYLPVFKSIGFNLFNLFDYLPVLKSKKSPLLAFFIGGLFGFLGCSIYFQTLEDLLIPLAVSIVLLIPVVTLVAIPFITALYGYFRAVNSNNRL
jgi:hypothetical protein